MARKSLTFFALLCAEFVAAGPAAWGESDAAPRVSFVREVAPILVSKCAGCHGPKTAESNYRLDTFALMMQPGDYALPPVTAARLEESELYRLITAEEAEERMPNNGDRLSDVEVGLISTWIQQGAAFDGADETAPLREQIPRDVPHPAAPASYPPKFPITAMTWSRDGARLIVGGYHEVLVWDAASGALAARIGNMPQRTLGLALSPDGAWLAVAGGAPGVTGEVRLIRWQDAPASDTPQAVAPPAAAAQAELQPVVLATLDDVFFDVAFRGDGQRLAASGADGAVRVFDVAAGAEVLKIANHADWVVDVCFSADGARLATASRDKTAKIFDAETGQLVASYAGHNAPVRGVAFSPDGKLAVSAGGRALHVWNAEDASLVGEIGGFGNEATAVLCTGEHAIAASADGSVRQIKLADRSLVRKLPDHAAWILSVACSEPPRRLAAGGFDGAVTIWNLDDGAVVKQFRASPSPASAAR
jgi:WD40 repeat protein